MGEESGGKTPAEAHRQVVRFLFLALDPVWRRLSRDERRRHQRDFVAAIEQHRGELLVRTYSLMGTRGDADLLLWQAANDLETLHDFAATLFGTSLGAYLTTSHSYLSMTRRSPYDLPRDHGASPPDRLRPAGGRYLYVYPFVKTREWYRLPAERRHALMQEHIALGRRYPGVTVNTTYSFGLDDQEFVVTFENDDPAVFSDLVMEMRSTEASAYTAQDTPVLTAIQMSLPEVLESLAGRRGEVRQSATSAEAWLPVAAVDDVPTEGGVRVYAGEEAVALFRVADRWHAVTDRCPHGRASLSGGTIDHAAATLRCPWHDGTFCLHSGRVVDGPPRRGIRTYDVRVSDGMVYLAPQGERDSTGSPSRAR